MTEPQTSAEDRRRSQGDSPDDPAELPPGYYYDDLTGYEIYQEEDEQEENQPEEPTA